MRVNDDFETWNASAQMNDDSSVLGFWQQALKVRKEHDVLVRLRSSTICDPADIADVGLHDVFRFTATSTSCPLTTHRCLPTRALWVLQQRLSC